MRLAIVVVVLVAFALAACSSDKQASVQATPSPVLSLLVTPVGVYEDGQPEPLTLADLDARLADVDDGGGVVHLELTGKPAAEPLSPEDQAGLDRLSRRVADLVREHGLGLVGDAGQMPVQPRPSASSSATW